MTTFTNFLACVVWGAVVSLRTVLTTVSSLPRTMSSDPGALGGSQPRAWAMFAGICLHFPGINANSALCLKTEATETALESGMAKGEFAGYFGNLRALTVAVGPFIFGAVGKQLWARPPGVCA